MPSESGNVVSVEEVIRNRISVRAFLPRPVPQALVHEILDCARWSPSGGNLQPWKVIAVSGAERDAVIALAAAQSGIPSDTGDGRPIYPADLWEPYRSRRFQIGEDLYRLLGIPREDRAGRLRRVARNFQFFGAPVGLFFVIDERMGHGQWAHLGMFMHAVALAAASRGLSSCFQEIWAVLRPDLKAHFGLPASEMVYCGMALGYADPDDAANRLRSAREPVEGFTTFLGFQSASAAPQG